MRPLVDSLFTGDTLAALGATYYDAAGQAQPGTPTWTSSAPGVASVDQASGTIHAVGPGSAVITANIRKLTGQGLVVVTAPLAVTLLLPNIVMLNPDTFVVPVSVRVRGGAPPVPWFQAPANAVFSIDSASGRIVTTAPGAALPFHVHADSVSADGTVQVLDPVDTSAGAGAYTVNGSVSAVRVASARAQNYTRAGDTLTFLLTLRVVVGGVTTEQVNLTSRASVNGAPDSLSLDSVSVAEAQGTSFLCHPARSAAVWSSSSSGAALLAVSRPGGWISVREERSVTGGNVVAGSFYFVGQRADFYDDPSGRLAIRGDFVAPLVQNPTTCH